MNFWWKFGLIVGSYLLVGTIGWHTHTWYDGYKKAKEEAVIIDDRLKGEKVSNDDAGKTAKKEADDDAKSRKTDAVVEKHIEENRPSFGCAVPPVGVLDLQQAVTTHTRARKPN